MTRATLLPLLLLAACGGRADELAALLPDERLVPDFPQQAEDGGASTARSTKGPEEDDYAPLYLFTADTTEEVNAVLARAPSWAKQITDNYRPSRREDGGSWVWGPWSEGPLDPAETELWVLERDDGSVSWGFDRWPKDAEEEAATVVEGTVEDSNSGLAERHGHYIADLDANHAIDPTDEAVGSLEVDYLLSGEAVLARAAFLDFGEAAVDATYRFGQVRDGPGFVDLAWLGPEGADGASPRLSLRSRWRQDGSGRTDLVVMNWEGEDWNSEEPVHVSECWDSSFHRVYYEDDLGNVEGDESDCSFPSAAEPSCDVESADFPCAPTLEEVLPCSLDDPDYPHCDGSD